MSNVTVIATCATISTRRVSARTTRPGSRVDSAFIEERPRDPFDASAGTNPTPRVTAAVISRQTANTSKSIRVSDRRTTVAGLSAINARTPDALAAIPSKPPAPASTPASTRHCRIRSHGRAPSARLTASSRERSALRATSSPVTFAQAMTSTRQTAPMSSHRARRAVPNTWSMNGVMATRSDASFVTCVTLQRLVASACACAVDTTGLILPST